MESLDKSHQADAESAGGDGGGGGGVSGGYHHSAAVREDGRWSSSDEDDGHCMSEIVDERRKSCVSECSVEVDLESGEQGSTKIHLAKTDRDCRICHLSFDGSNPEFEMPIELGCSCKDDLAAAHKQCAEAWFKIKGNKVCEICGSVARNVAGASEAELSERQWNEANDNAAVDGGSGIAPPREARNFWQGHRFLNFLLACMVFAFVISWLFHFNVPS